VSDWLTVFSYLSKGAHLVQIESQLTWALTALTSEAPHPAQLNAFIAAYKDLLSQGISPKQIVFMGDSAGGGLSVLSGIECIRQQLPQPAASILISPWMDFSMRAYEGGNALVETDFVASANEIVPILGDAFIGSSGYTRTSPEVNPLYLDPNFVKGLNPQLIFVGAAEFCIADSKDWADICRKGLVEHDLVVERGELHIYAMGSKWLTHAVREKTYQKMFGWMKKYVG
jgi:epsilon-lactone hydrolase